jgi:uncharacterized membrane protein YdjX (TVP38/TMEM64 family)
MRIHLLHVLVFVCLLGAVALTWLNRDRLTAEALTAWIEHRGYWGPAVFIGVYTIAPVLFLPGSVLTLAGGALFGPLTGALFSLTGATIGATVAFLKILTTEGPFSYAGRYYSVRHYNLWPTPSLSDR